MNRPQSTQSIQPEPAFSSSDSNATKETARQRRSRQATTGKRDDRASVYADNEARSSVSHERSPNDELPVAPEKAQEHDREAQPKDFRYSRRDGNDKEVRASVRIKARLPTQSEVYTFYDSTLANAFKQAQQDNPFEAKQFLISVSLLKVNIDDPKLPRPGDVVMVTPYKTAYKRYVYRNSRQIDAKLYGLTKINIS
ncbi:uncharacterized protein PITG_15169 [Phytophthora infestans T30-4]|uniref:Uncharacterized protein n=1 Tax=Phytophthora infestans (strain T30-4) TaxID=403677 RepID=D0NRT6_PHYIT|nr:uncharacterized protein PITG_15169 [Phytophthora infestans T30-4]EEY63436.1 conserved hypothetical protein [Phytophthora infestans T30-4]|eukprot:XP_002898321.1 conserved hypothetical protein [Phytophthora infestans T30-4]